ncbi:helix-turn-helix domain-containing protein [bacterium]|nr:helix-turn-helix domain-containing protein [bacterium]
MSATIGSEARRPWFAPIEDGDAYRRAGGRRAYNARRTFAREARLRRIVEMMHRLPRDITSLRFLPWGSQQKLADRLGVHPGTISRDLKALRDESIAARGAEDRG